jgi:hypothetical protein
MSDRETTENFWQAWNNFEWPEPVPVTYRLYYNNDGTPKCYTMELLSGKYIELDRETYVLSPWNVRVIDEKLHIIPPVVTVKKLQPSNTNGTSCHPQDICVVVASDQNHKKWKLTVNETH